MFNRSISVVATVLLFHSIPFTVQSALAGSPRIAPSVVEKSTSDYEETPYTLGVGDRIHVDFLDTKDYSGEYAVLIDGTIGFPLIGSFKINGMTIAELTELLEREYSRYIKRPILSVVVTSPRPMQISVSGEVNTPGTYTLGATNGKYPVLTDMIKQSGGLTTAADANTIKVIRIFQKKQQIYTLSLLTLLETGDIAQDISLRDGDIIFVPTKRVIEQKQVRELSNANFGIQATRGATVAIIGEIVRPGTYIVGGASVTGATTTGNVSGNSTAPRVSLALRNAGGTKPMADIRNIEIQRTTRAGEVQIIPVDLWALIQSGNVDEDILLQDGDTISIPVAKRISPKEAQILASANFAPDKIRVILTGELKGGGNMELTPNTPLNQAIYMAGGFNEARADKSSVQLVRLNPNGTVTTRIIPVDLASGINDEHNPILLNNDIVIVNRNGLAAFSDGFSLITSPLYPVLNLVNTANTFSNWGGH